MNCQKCGNKIKEGDEFCQSCGVPVVKVAKGVRKLLRGRVGRKYFFLGLFSLMLAFAVILGIVFICFALLASILPDGIALVIRWFGGALILLCSLIALSFVVSLYVRRIHDIGKSAWWLLLLLVPFLNYVVVFYLLFKKGEASRNRFGDEPLSEAGLMDTIFNRQP